MALGLIGLLDLSIVTDALKALLTKAFDDSPMWTTAQPKFAIDVTGAAPDTRGGSGCVLSLFLFHVEPDRFQRNTLQAPKPNVAFQPMALDLYYLLTAWAGDNYVQEQKAMSIAFRCLHQNPIVRFDVDVDNDIDTDRIVQELTITMESGTTDELARLWQSLTSPARLSAIYKASVVFITPDEAGPSAKPVKKVVTTAAPPKGGTP